MSQLPQKCEFSSSRANVPVCKLSSYVMFALEHELRNGWTCGLEYKPNVSKGMLQTASYIADSKLLSCRLNSPEAHNPEYKLSISTTVLKHSLCRDQRHALEQVLIRSGVCAPECQLICCSKEIQRRKLNGGKMHASDSKLNSCWTHVTQGNLSSFRMYAADSEISSIQMMVQNSRSRSGEMWAAKCISGCECIIQCVG